MDKWWVSPPRSIWVLDSRSGFPARDGRLRWRRDGLIIVLLVLLAISTVAALLAPPIERDPIRPVEQTTTGSEAEAPPAEPTGNGEVLTERIDTADSKPTLIAALAGDRLALTVSSEEADLGRRRPPRPLRLRGRRGPRSIRT